jgi:general nucleoside transport system permease protein
MSMAGLIDAALLDSVMRALIPILLAATGGMICERAGVFQISLEGLMLIGAFAAVAGSFWAGSAAVGLLTAMAAGALVSLILAYGTVTRGGDPIVLGVAINLLALGLTSFLIVQLFGVRGVFQSPDIVGLPRLVVPVLNEIPVIGSSLFRLTALGYLAMFAVPALWVWLFKTASGTRLRGVGERPQAAATLGVNPVRVRYLAVGVSGVFAGLAGAQLSLGNVVQFSENMSSGRGWIAVVAVLLGRAHPIGVLGACLLFGLAEGLGFRLQGQGLPVQITDALPFVVTLVALAVARKRFTRVLDLTAA